MNITIESKRLTAPEYIDFLKRTDLGAQYPKERFAERIEKLVRNDPSASLPETWGKLLACALG